MDTVTKTDGRATPWDKAKVLGQKNRHACGRGLPESPVARRRPRWLAGKGGATATTTPGRPRPL